MFRLCFNLLAQDCYYLRKEFFDYEVKSDMINEVLSVLSADKKNTASEFIPIYLKIENLYDVSTIW
jgi:hypothetical protein